MKKKIALTGLAGVIGIVYYFVLVHFHFSIPCIFHLLTGLQCPGCGVTRMIVYLLHLNFRAAFYQNQAIFILFPFILYFAGKLYISWLFRKKYILCKVENILLYSMVFVLLVFAVWRNIV